MAVRAHPAFLELLVKKVTAVLVALQAHQDFQEHQVWSVLLA